MIVVRKPFEKLLYDKFDKEAKRVCSEYLLSTGRFNLTTALQDQGEAFKKRDFYVIELQTGKEILCECEVKAVWTKSGKWQSCYWTSIDIPYRKKSSQCNLFFVVNRSLDTIAIIKREDLLNSPVGLKNTKNSYTGMKTIGEEFFQVPLSKILFYHKRDGKWALVNGF